MYTMSATTMTEINPLTRLLRQLSFISSASGVSNVSKKPSYMIRLRRDEDGRVVVRCSNLQGVVTDGADESEAIRNAKEAIDGILEARKMNKEYNITVIHT
jgi:predicted RNase H-like HicB family nuclease